MTIAAGSQLAAAVRFLKAHPGQVPFITIDIGANDALFHCFHNNGVFSRHCVIEDLPRIQHRLAHIAHSLRISGRPRRSRSSR